jgi:glutathione S-transferase
MPITFFAHHGCPFVQRVAIVLAEKGIPHLRQDIDFRQKPADFLAASPLGQVPAILLEGASIFDSLPICEYLDEQYMPRLHPDDPVQRARHRAWMAFGNALLQSIGGFFKTRDPEAFIGYRREIVDRLAMLERELTQAPYFDGTSFSMVDVVFAPIFRYFEAFSRMESFDFFSGLERVPAWRQKLTERPSVAGAVQADFLPKLVTYLQTRGSTFSSQAIR